MRNLSHRPSEILHAGLPDNGSRPRAELPPDHLGPSVTNRLRVLLLIKGLDHGGAERLLSLMAEARDRERFDYEAAYLLPWKRGLVKNLERAGLVVHCLQGGKEWNATWGLRLRRLVIDRHIDVIHAHSPYIAGIARMTTRSLPPSARPRFVYTEHLPWDCYVTATRVLNALTFPLDDAHLAVSAAVRDSIPRPLRRRVEVAIHGIKRDDVLSQAGFRDGVRAELGVAPHEVLVGTLANLRPQKGYPVLLEAARLVLDAGLPARFVAAGGGPAESEIRARQKALGLGDRFLLLGRREDAIRILAGCDVFVLSSLYEGLPVALMEAMTIGLPVVATAVGGVVEAVTAGREGLLVPPGRPDVLAQAIADLVSDPRRRGEMGQAARRRAASFDIVRVVRRVEQIYLDTARGKAPKRGAGLLIRDRSTRSAG
jgi:L-malate glycosyltransferase